MLRKKDPKSRVRVIPPNDSLVGIGLILDPVNRLPRVLGEGDMGAGLSGIDASIEARTSTTPLRLSPISTPQTSVVIWERACWRMRRVTSLSISKSGPLLIGGPHSRLEAASGPNTASASPAMQ